MDTHEQALRRQLSALFAEELVERVEELRRVVAELEQAETEETRASLHRVLHVIKGASRSVGEESIEGACHRLESAIAELAPDARVPIATLLELADALDEARAPLRAGDAVPAPRFDRIASTDPSVSEVIAPPPTPVLDEAETLRVPASALDALVAASADVLQARQSLTPLLRSFEELREQIRTAGTNVAWFRSLERDHRKLGQALDRVSRSSEILDDQIRRLRLRPFEEVVAGCTRIVRDAAVALGKQVELEIDARGVQLDRVQVEALRDVMVQLVRNSVAHGIELPGDRLAAGKPERGQITVEASPRGDALTIVVRDDGAGLDLKWLESLAASRGRVVTERRALARLIFEPGVSSAPMLTEVAGRGVGLDVVRQRVERLHGSIGVDWIEKSGTTFTIEIPITVATLRSLIVESAGSAYALPVGAVERLIWVTPAAIKRGETRHVMRVGTDWLSVASLRSVLGATDSPATRRVPGVIVSRQGRRVVLAVDRILDTVELAFEPLDPRLGRIRGVAGASTLPDGTIALILQASDLVDEALGTSHAEVFAAAPPTRAVPTILLVDDSATTRALEANILRAAGYEVRTAVDGEDAWRQLNELRSDLIVSDVDMPNLDGIELTERVRASPTLGGIPVVLVTARGTDADKARGMRAGANAYLVKSSFDHTVLLEALTRLL